MILLHYLNCSLLTGYLKYGAVLVPANKTFFLLGREVESERLWEWMLYQATVTLHIAHCLR